MVLGFAPFVLIVLYFLVLRRVIFVLFLWEFLLQLSEIHSLCSFHVLTLDFLL